MKKLIFGLLVFICLSCENKSDTNLNAEIIKEKNYTLYRIKDSYNNTVKMWGEFIKGDSTIVVVWKNKGDKIPDECSHISGLDGCQADHELCHILNDLFDSTTNCKENFNDCVSELGCDKMKIPRISIDKGRLLVVEHNDVIK